MTQASKGTPTTVEDGIARDGPRVNEGTPIFEGTDVPIQTLFDYLDEGYNLYAFLDKFPAVSPDLALEAVRRRLDASSVIHSDRQIVSGTPVFKGTRVMVKNLFDYLAHGYTLDVFLDQFPTVSREQAIQALESANDALESNAYESASR